MTTDKPLSLLCISGATSGSTGLYVRISDPPGAIVVEGLPITPLESDPSLLHYSVLTLCNRIHSRVVSKYGSHGSDCLVTFGLSSTTTGGALEQLVSAADHGGFGRLSPEKVSWITRGEACYYAAGLDSDAIVAKTGTVAFAHGISAARSGPRVMHRVGGWGLMSGDDGGAYHIGRSVLFRLFQEQDGRADRTEFSDQMERLMGSGFDIPSLVSWIRRQRIEQALRVEVSELARVAIYLAEEKHDKFCMDLLWHAARHVGVSCRVAASRLKSLDEMFGMNGIDVVLHGRLIKHSPMFATYVLASIGKELEEAGFGNIRFIPLQVRPILGCLMFTLRERLRYSIADSTSIGAQLKQSLASQLGDEFGSGVLAAFARGDK